MKTFVKIIMCVLLVAGIGVGIGTAAEEEDAKTTQSLQEEDNRYSFLPLAGETGYEHHSQLNWFD